MGYPPALDLRGAQSSDPASGAGASGVFRWPEAEAALSKRFSSKSLEGMAAKAAGLNADIHADAEYRAHLIGVMARRAVDAAVGK